MTELTFGQFRSHYPEGASALSPGQTSSTFCNTTCNICRVDRLTTLFIHVETCRNMLYAVEGSLIRIKKCCIDKCCATIHFLFCSSRLVWNNFRGKMFSAFDHAKTQQCATECPTNVACCIRKVELGWPGL